MATETKIQWCDHTFNPWRGCLKVSPGCAHCYAEVQSKRNPRVLGEWGPDGKRAIAAESYWQEPYRWNKQAAAAGERRRVFCASLADVFEMNAQVVEARRRLFQVIDVTPNLDWLLLTKRPENIQRLWHSRTFVDDQGRRWGRCEPGASSFRRDNVWLGTSVEDQQRANERIPQLIACANLAPILFLSIEPLLEPIDLSPWLTLWGEPGITHLDWVICGGESGQRARPFHLDWARDLLRQCREAGVAFFFKQAGSNPHDAHESDTAAGVHPLDLIDRKGGDLDELPADLRVREFPQGVANGH